MSRRSPTGRVAGTAHLVGARLKQKRLEAGLRLKDVSSLTGIHISSVSRFEHGIYQATVPQLEVLATAVGCSATDLLTAGTEGEGVSSGAT
jgi:transcriptional regulator with XRE-family HTH domain